MFPRSTLDSSSFWASSRREITTTARTLLPFIAAWLAAAATPACSFAEVITNSFGSGANAFTIDFVRIGNAGNAADFNTGYGAVPYEYRMGVYEISQDAITKATASGMANVTAGPWTANRPATQVSWYEAAAFVNWLNTSTGRQAAYDLTFSGSGWSMALWSPANAWQQGGQNLYRHKDAFYFLPSENEWYKAAYYNAGASNYVLYPTGGNAAPTAVASGTGAGTAVFGQPGPQGPAAITSAGGLGLYGTMGQAGNVWEWSETAFDGINNSATENRALRGGVWNAPSDAFLSLIGRDQLAPTTDVFDGIGIRVASVPEPSTWGLAVIGMSAARALNRLTRNRRNSR